MSDHDIEELEKYLGTLKWVVGLGWALLAGAFALGVWVASLEIRQSAFTDKIFDHEVALKNQSGEINSLHIKQAVNGNDLAYIKAAVERIEKKVTP